MARTHCRDPPVLGPLVPPNTGGISPNDTPRFVFDHKLHLWYWHGVSADPSSHTTTCGARHRRPAMTRTSLRLFVLALAAALAALVLPGTAQAAPYCGITWGSLAKQAGNSAAALPGTELTAVRAGQHTCYDRLVLDVSGGTRVASYRVEYVSAVHSDASGAVVPLRGGAFLQISVGVNNMVAPP